MNDSSLEATSLPRRRHVVTWLLCAAALGVMVLLVTLLLAKRRRDDERVVARELAEALAEADRLDPGWRLEDIEAKRPALPDNANSARCIEAVIALLPNDWPKEEPLIDFSRPPTEPLPPESLMIVRRELDRVGPALAEARRLEKLPRGRFRTAPNPDPQVARKCSYLLHYEARRLIEDGDINGALACSRATLNASRSLGDPDAISQLVRVAVRAVALSHIERALAAGITTPNVLVECQHELEEENTYPVHLAMRRGERIRVHALLGRLADGSEKWSKQFTLLKRQDATSDAEMAEMARRFHGRLLRAENQFVEIAKRPLHEQRSLLAEEEQKLLAELPERGKGLNDSTRRKLLESCLRSQASLRCAIVGLAAERFRLRKERWPMTLGELTPEFLSAVPLDPFDGQPLRYRRLDDGFVVYSVGPKGEGDGTKVGIEHHWDVNGQDIGFRLWDEDRRRFSKKAPRDP
jgi:hypothetical protein